MSDFDREAERERLREQFEKDKQKREQSERMSELLLKGATMTNAHCDRCGDPIFRWNGQEFCPTCQGGPAGEGAGAQQTEQPDQATHPEADGQPADAEPQQSARSPEDATPTEPTAPDPAATAEPTEPTEPTQPTRTVDRRVDPSGASDDASSVASNDASSVAAARASLARTLAALSEQAETAEDLATTRQYLTAAKEAAEALDAAERAGR